MTVYQIDVASGDGYVKYAQAYGDLETINYIAKKVVKEIEGLQGSIVLTLNEVDEIGGANTVRTVVDLTANARVVSTVLKGELTSERKAARQGATEDEADENAGSGEPTMYVTGAQTDTNDPTY